MPDFALAMIEHKETEQIIHIEDGTLSTGNNPIDTWDAIIYECSDPKLFENALYEGNHLELLFTTEPGYKFKGQVVVYKPRHSPYIHLGGHMRLDQIKAT